MLDTDKLREVAENILEGSDLYVVDLKAKAGNVIELLIDSDTSVSIDDCVRLNRAIDAEFDRDQEDYELTVASAGIGQPLKVPRQYRKLFGRPVEVVLKDGGKFIAELRDADGQSITVAYTEKVAVEGKKKKETVETVKTFPLDTVKATREYLDFK